MEHILDLLLVAIAVLGAVAYAIHALAPKTWRNRWYARLGLHSAQENSSGCGGCDNCGDTDNAAAKPTEIRIAANSIKRRSKD
jgi:hypothetical protein